MSSLQTVLSQTHFKVDNNFLSLFLSAPLFVQGPLSAHTSRTYERRSMTRMKWEWWKS